MILSDIVRFTDRTVRPEPDQKKRKKIVWGIERKLVEDDARPSIFYPRSGICRYPYMKRQVATVNGKLQ